MTEPARTLGRYQIVRTIGSGGMGEVYLAHDPVLARNFALKVLPSHVLNEKDQLTRFAHEIRAASVVDHPNIVRIYEVAFERDLAYLVMEHVEGRDLRRVIEEQSPLPLSQTLHLGRQIASALTALHEHGVLHRDLKPENIMLNQQGDVKLLDFGLATFVTSYRDHASPEIAIGTPSYMSPEQIRGGPVDVRSDLFSLGVILYELATGRSPFSGRTIPEKVAAILSESPAPLYELNDAVHERFSTLVLRLLEADYRLRYPSTRELSQEMYAIQRSLQVSNVSGTRNQAAALNRVLDDLSTDLSTLLADMQDYKQELLQHENWARSLAHKPEETAK